MKNFKIAILFLSAVAIVSCKTKDKVVENNIFSYEKEAIFPKIEELNLNTYVKSSKNEFTMAKGNELLKMTAALATSKQKFTINSEMRGNSETWFSCSTDPSASVSFNLANGDFKFNNGMAKYLANQNTNGLLKNTDAEKMALNYVQKLRLPVEEGELVVAHIGGLNKGVHVGNKTEIFEKLTSVRFDRILNGIPVMGHSRIVFQMGESGKIQSLISKWTQVEKREAAKDELVMAPEDLKRLLEKSIMEENVSAKKIAIEAIKPVYFDDGSGIIEPALHVVGSTMYDMQKGEKFPYDAIIPLLKSPKLQYSFQHKNFRNKPKEMDKGSDKNRIKQSPDDQNKYKL